ncbi:MAG TPA: glycosyltransferase family 39 protein [Anaerolineales bacterium]|nr:glycosyltransferase family 39 protein [Anaerolineales bacterium]
MKTALTNKIGWNTLGTVLVPILVALLFLTLTFAYFPFREKLQYDSDEGLNLMRSMLVALGYPLYSEVSSDQPPLFNQLLAMLFRVVGFEVNPARLLVLLFSTLVVWSCAQFLQITWGKLAAALFLPLALMLPQYLRLSTSVMIGLPSIALATTSMLFVVLWHQRRSNIWLVLSGFMLALSVLIKLFTGLVSPIFLAGITLAAFQHNREDKISWRVFRPALIWGISFASLAVVLGLLLVGPQNVWSIIFPHIAAPTTGWLQGEGYGINVRLQEAVPFLVLGCIGALISLYRRNWLTLYPLAWAILAYILFSFHAPVFYHHQLLITVPAAMLAAAGTADGLQALLDMKKLSHIARPRTLLGIGALIAFLWVSTVYIPVLDKQLMNRPRLTGFNIKATPGKLKVLRTMNEYVDQTEWILTDMPIYAFRVHRPVPPILATFSTKRLVTGSLTEEDILTAIKDYQPEQVLMARFNIPALEEYLEQHYTLILSAEFFRLFIRNDIDIKTATP